MEQERFERGGGLDTEDQECKFAPEVYSRQEGEEYRTKE